MTTCKCPACEGTGHTVEFLCCGRLGDGGCCGSPDVDDVPCSVCSATGTASLEAFLEFAIQSRDRSLLAEYEAMRVIETIGPEGLPYRRKPSRAL